MNKIPCLLLAVLLAVTLIAEAAETAAYTCPMHPHYISTDPDGICPICGMDLVPVAAPVSNTPTGVVVAPEMLQTMGVRVAPAVIRSFGRTVRAFGNVEANTRRESVSASRLEGWIENLAVTAEGDTVRPGQLLYRIYSPDLVAAQKDFLAALKIGDATRINASEQRLRSLGMQLAAISSLREARALMERIPVFAEAGGVVRALAARDGTYVKPGDAVLKLQSYADVWVMASIAEQDIGFVASGLPVTIEFPSAPAAPREGRIDYVYPTIDPATRTLQVRIVVDNEQGHLRPGAFADVAFAVDAGNKLAVPSEAILRDGRGNHVMVALGGGRFAARAVGLGTVTGEYTEVLTGLEAGEQVVVSGQFMLDSETNLREGFAKLSLPTSGPDTPLASLPVNADDLALLDHFVDTALYFHEALVDRYAIEPTYLDPAIHAGDSLKSRFPGTRLADIVGEAQSILVASRTSSGEEMPGMQLERLVAALEPWLTEGAPIHYRDLGLTLFREDGSDRRWLQQSSTPRNPWGSNTATALPWPDPMASPVPAALPSGAGAADPHAGHR